MSKSIIIIGGGIAGLSAGIYARMNGFNSAIYEMNSMAGGLCTAWSRKDFTIFKKLFTKDYTDFTDAMGTNFLRNLRNLW